MVPTLPGVPRVPNQRPVRWQLGPAAVMLMTLLACDRDVATTSGPLVESPPQVILSNTDGLSAAVADATERILPSLLPGEELEALVASFRRLQDALVVGRKVDLRTSLKNTEAAVARYATLNQKDAGVGAELDALQLVTAAVAHALASSDTKSTNTNSPF